MTDDSMLLFPSDANWDEAQTTLLEHEIGDGLPMVVPTEERLARMLAKVSDRDVSFGPIPPLFGDLTPRAVAYQCVLAGCAPQELPLVFSAVEATTDDAFNLLGVATTTGTVGVAVIAHGPVAKALGLNSSTNCLGPGNRANACIGRAVSLCLRNIGGARAGVGDMATMGQPGKYTFCFAEDETGIYPALHERRGFVPNASAVTVLGVAGTLEVLPSDSGDSPEAILAPIATVMRASYAVSGAARKSLLGEQVVLLPPELATFIARRGWDLPRIQEYLFEQSVLEEPGTDPPRLVASKQDLHVIVTGGPGVKITYLPLWGGGSATVTRALRAF